MATIHYKFPHIEQLRNILVALKHEYQNPVQTTDGWVFDETLPLPTIMFEGTVKLHGSNCAIVINSDGTIYAQSRETILTPQSDYKGFAKFVADINPNELYDMLPFELREEAHQRNVPLIIYGEWCGQGIQGGVGISQLPKMFVIFAMKIGEKWCDPYEFCKITLPSKNIRNVYEAPGLDNAIKIDFNNISEDLLSELGKLTEDIEKECPFAKLFGISGIGEGIVWRSLMEKNREGDPWLFKTKGEKHKNVKETKVVQLNPDVAASNAEVVSSVLTEQRLSQGIEKLGEMGLEVSKKNTPAFLKWIQDDIRRENRDLIEALKLNEIEALKLNEVAENALFRDIQKQAREWFFKQPGV